MIDVISATRKSESEFWEKSPLGFSLDRLAYDKRLQAKIIYSNAKGLSEVYNFFIQQDSGNDILVFMHDDIFIDDFFIADHLLEALNTFDIIGVAGNQRRVENQPAWCFVNDQREWDSLENLSGSLAHAKHPFGSVSCYGPVKRSCELLDGVFLATKRSTLKQHQLLFDCLFQFHFYDLDFCRSAREKGLSLGTWPIALTHLSGGSFGNQAWQDSLKLYRSKWKN